MTDTPVDVNEELLSAAESVFDGWFAEQARIDWDEFIDRLENLTDIDMGSSMVAPHIEAIKKHIRAYRKLG